MLVAAAEALVRAAERLADLVEIDDVAVGDQILGERFDRVALEPIGSLAGFGELDQF